MKSIRLNTNIKVILAVVISFFLLYLLYSQVYIRNREEDMIQTRFRVLDNMGENVKAKMGSYRKNADTYYEQVIKSVDKNIGQDTQVVCFTKSISNDSIKLICSDLKNDKINQKKFFIGICIPDTIKEYSKTYNPDLKYKRWIIYKKDSISKFFEYYKNRKDILVYKTWEANPYNTLVVKDDSVLIVSGSLEFYLPPELIVKNIERPDVFDQTLLIAENKVLYNSSQKDLKLIKVQAKVNEGSDRSFHFIPESGSDTFYLPINEDLQSVTIHTDKCYNIKLSDGKYRLFLKPIKVGQNDWFIGGLVNTAKFDREKHSIPTWMIILLSLAFVIILLSLPFVKLWAMSKTELLGKSTIFHVALALLVGFTFIVFYFFFQQHYFARSGNRNRELKDLSKNINNSLNAELQKIYQVVRHVDDSMTARVNLEKKITPINNIFSHTNSWKITQYPYFDYIYWLDTTGMQKYEITPFSNLEQLQKYDFRDYFKKYNEWYANLRMPDTSRYRIPGNVKFYMESIVSVTSGDYKVAYSTESQLFKPQKYRIVMTGRFNSLIDPILPEGYCFCIIDPNGQVLFHSNKYQNMAENFIRECGGDRSLQAAIHAEIPRIMDVKYYNIPYRIYIKPMEGLPLFIVTMYDLRMEYAYQAQSFITTSVLITCLFLYFFFQLILFLLLKRFLTTSKDKESNLRTEFSKLKISKVRDYIRLIWICIFSAIGLYLIIYFMPAAQAIVSIFMLTTVMITILLLRLHDYKCNRPVILYYLIINSLILIFLFIVSMRISGVNSSLFWIFLILLIFMTVINFSAWFNKFRIKKLHADYVYSGLIFMLLIIFGVAPVLKFYQIAVDIENENQVRLTQLELARSREDRNKIYETYYKRIAHQDKETDMYRDQVHKSRMDLGEYCYFWHETAFDVKSEDRSNHSVREQVIDSIINEVRPVYSDPLSIESKYLSIDKIPDRIFNWKFFNDTIELSYSSPTQDIEHIKAENIYIRSVIHPQSILFPFSKASKYLGIKAPLFYLLLISILAAGFGLILLSTRKLFGISLLPEEQLQNPYQKIVNYLDSGISILIINPSGITGLRELLDIISTDHNTETYEWDTLEGIDATTNILVKDLTKDHLDPEKFGDRLDHLFNSIEKHPNFIIVTDINPQKILQFYEEKARVGKFALKADKNPDEQQSTFRKTYYKLKAMLNLLALVDVPLNYEGKDMSGKKRKDPGILFKELGNTYCKHIIDNCSAEELLVLLDLSGDTIANVTNIRAVKRLIYKGLLRNARHDYHIRYIELEAYLDSNYNSRYRKELTSEAGDESGKWSGYKTAILLVSIILLAFIFISNQQFLSNITKLVATVGASLIAITNLFNMVTKKNS